MLSVAVFCAGCQKGYRVPLNKTSIQEIIASLESETLEDREITAEQLRELVKQGMSVEDGLIALRTASREYPPRKYDFLDSSEDLIEAAAVHPRSEYISVIVELYPTYNEKAKAEALALLAQLDDRDAAVAWMDIIRSYARDGGVPSLRIWLLQSTPRHADVFFPELLDYADIQPFSYDVYLLCLTYFQQGLLISEELLPYSKLVLDDYRAYEEDLRSSQQLEGIAWMWNDEYQEWRNHGSLLLDLMGYFSTPEVKEKLREALTFEDPRLKHFAVVSLLRFGENLDTMHILDVAKSAEMRNHLYNELARLGLALLFPKEYETQEAFAESDMVNWLVFPTELGRVPDKIELMKVVEVDTGTDDGFLDYYVFRFCTEEPNWAAKDGWMAGVSGPFLRKDAPSPVAYGDTFSAFEPWESKTPEEHVGNIQKIDSWREYHKNR